MKKIFYSTPQPKELFTKIKPAKGFVPDWYKKIPNFNYKNIKFVNKNEGNNFVKKNIKNCLPFLDSMISGYTVELFCDIYIENINGDPKIMWESEYNPLERRTMSEADNPIPVPHGYNKAHYAWKVPYAFKIPSGISIIVTHPFNRFDLPFITLTGIVDGGWTMWPGNLPFYVKDGFEGLIPRGTPIAQIIPFVSDNWQMVYQEEVWDEAIQDNRIKFKTFFDNYKNKIRIDKSNKYN